MRFAIYENRSANRPEGISDKKLVVWKILSNKPIWNKDIFFDLKIRAKKQSFQKN